MRLNGKAAIITGAAQGIGAAMAVRFIEEGAFVTLCDVDSAGIKKTSEKLKELNGRFLLAQGDITDRGFVKQMVDDTVNEFGTLDIMVNNAAITRDAILHKMTEAQWDQVMDVNLKGTFNCLQAAAIYMRTKGKGSIINVSSTARFGNIGQLNYSSTKGGVVALTRTAAKELARKNIRCNCISPGTIKTPMVETIPNKVIEEYIAGSPLGRFGDPREVAQLCVFIASDEASYITGQVINCDGGSFMA